MTFPVRVDASVLASASSVVHTSPGRQPIAELAAAFAPAGDPRVLAQTLEARAGEYRRALRRGGTRAEFARWQAGLDALQAALAILGRPDSNRPDHRPAPDGDSPWKSLSARSIRP
jgi:hypothetical protein